MRLKKVISFLTVLVMLFSITINARVVKADDESGKYSSYVFTIQDIALFSYDDNNAIKVFDSQNKLIWEGTLNNGEHHTLNVAQNVYKVVASKKFSVLAGDPISCEVSGYYAMDKDGYGTSTEFLTWAPSVYGHCKFVVFSYEDGTNVEVIDNATGENIWKGTLNKGKHWDIESLSSRWIQVKSTKRVSCLTAYDQGYFVPASTGKWSGKEFYTYVSDIENWGQDFSVFSYKDNTKVEVKDTETGEIIWNGILNNGESYVKSYPSGANKFLSVTSSENVTVACQPWKSYTSGYQQGTYVPDEFGTGIGTNFITTSLDGGYVNVIAYKDDTIINIYNSTTKKLVKTYNLNAGQFKNVNPGNGIWNVKSNKNISVYSGYGAYSAAFVPVEFGKLVKPRFLVNVMDSNTWEPISGATVTVGDQTAVTNDKGIAEFTDLSAGTAEIHITKDGYDEEIYKKYNITDNNGCYFTFLDESEQ